MAGGRPRSHNLSPGDIEDIKTYWVHGERDGTPCTLMSLALDFDVSKSMIYYLTKGLEQKVKAPRGFQPKIPHRKVVELRKTMSAIQIADRLGYSRAQVFRILRDAKKQETRHAT